ncbi:MAG: hypothetical protein WCG01_02615 [bacterium]
MQTSRDDEIAILSKEYQLKINKIKNDAVKKINAVVRAAEKRRLGQLNVGIKAN